MGSGATRKCPKCGFEFRSSEGVGFLFPMEYAETVEKAKNGEFGEQLQIFLVEHKDGAINTEKVTLCCEECGNLSGGMDLTMYVPNNKKPDSINRQQWSVAFHFEGADYVSPMDLKEHYVEYAKYPHKCEKCGGKMRVIKKEKEFVCPECKVPLKTTGVIHWD